jgi:peptidyl-prolyl cis-trans isomerase C
MRRGPARPLGLAALAAFSLSLVCVGPAAGDAKGDLVVARVGPVSITAAELERRLRGLPRFQLATFGRTSDEIRRAYLQRVLVPEALYAAGAKARKLDETPALRDRIQDSLRSVRMSALRAELLATGGVSQDDVTRYYESNRSRFDSPDRVAVWRILCKTKDEAAEVLAEARKSGGPDRWNQLAREHSTDEPTRLRGGNLGFLSPDGTSNEQGVKAEVAIVAAAAKLKDGEIAPEPIAEGAGFAVVWRRGSMPAVHRSLEQESVAIRQVLLRQKLEQGAKDLVKRLRESHVSDQNPQLVDMVEVDGQGEIGQRRRPGVVPRKPVSKPGPSQTLKGLR